MKYVQAYMFCIFLSVAWGCQLTPGDPTEVVERSRSQAPAWVGEYSVVPSLGQESLRWVQVKERVFDLPLGLRQAHTSALQKARRQTSQLIQEYWRSQGLLTHLSPDELRKVHSQLRQVMERQIDEGLVEDVYFERRGFRDTSGTADAGFVVYVYLAVPKERVSTMFRDLQETLRVSQTQSLRQFAQNRRAFPFQTGPQGWL